MRKLKNLQQFFLTIIASIILGIFAINPTLSTIGNLQKQIDDDKFVESKLEEKINNLSILQEKYTSIQKDLPIVYSGLPKTTQMSLLIGQLQSLAKNSNIKIDIIQTFETDSLNSPVLYGNYSSFDFEISAEGNYQDTKTFISSLINFQRVVSVGNISLSKSKDINNSGLILNIKGDCISKGVNYEKNDILIILIPTFIFVLVWMGFSIYHSIVASTISETVNMQIAPISPNFDTKTIDSLRERQNVLPIYDAGVMVETPTPYASEVSQAPIATQGAKQATSGGSLTQ